MDNLLITTTIDGKQEEIKRLCGKKKYVSDNEIDDMLNIKFQLFSFLVHATRLRKPLSRWLVCLLVHRSVRPSQSCLKGVLTILMTF